MAGARKSHCGKNSSVFFFEKVGTVLVSGLNGVLRMQAMTYTAHLSAVMSCPKAKGREHVAHSLESFFGSFHLDFDPKPMSV